MEKNKNNSYKVYEKIPEEERKNWHLYLDAVYKANPEKRNLGAEVISKLLTVGNQGGFRFLGSIEEPSLVVLFTSGEDIYWKDELDTSSGLLLYYGDNKTPGNDLHNTSMHGNEILRNVFNYACSDDITQRKKIPPIFVFKKNNSIYDSNGGNGRDVKFLGLAVPGIIGKPNMDWLTAVWGRNKNGDRFQNYKAFFTVLDTSKGSLEEPGNYGINLAWVNDIRAGKTFDSNYAPIAWKNYIEGNKIFPLSARCAKISRTKEDQLPSNPLQLEMLRHLQKYFVNLDGGYSFELFACNIIQYMDPAVIDINTTSPYKDGGFDGIGKYKIFEKVENEVLIDFYVQAKCFNPDKGLRVDDTARLISRIKNRQFGILITTSYITKQAYDEIIEDGHPVVIITGRNIIEFIFNKLEKRSVEDLDRWLKCTYNKPAKVVYAIHDENYLEVADVEK